MACVALPLVIAKPFVSCARTGPAVARGPQAVVLVIDNSFAMGWRKGGDTLFAQAKQRARKILDELGPEADIAVLFTAEGSEAPGELSRDHLRLRDTIGDARLSTRPGDTKQALRRAAALLDTSSHAARRVYLFSLLAAKGFPPGEPAWPPGGGPELHVISPLGDEAPPNLAIVSIAAEKDAEVGPRGVRVSAEVANFGPARVVDRAVTVRVGGKPVARGLVSIGAGERATKKFSITLPADTRSAEVTVELDGDELAIDDRRMLRVQLRRELRVLVVDGDPSAVRHEDETFYLETALRPGDRADSSLVVTATTVDELPRRRLSDHDVVFLVNVKPLDPPRVAELEAWVRKGGGLFVALGDNVDVLDVGGYDEAMRPLLAQELQSVKEVAVGLGGDDKSRRGESIGRFEKLHPIFSVFAASGAGLSGSSFWRYVLVSPSSRGQRDTLARLSGGAPLLVEARLGQGRLLLYTSTLDRDWNNLPVHKGYLPLVQQAARHLARAQTDEAAAELLVGQTRDLVVLPSDRRLEVTSPSGERTVFEGTRLEGRKTVSFAGTDEPGIYRVSVTSEDGTARPRPSADFVVNVDPRGSDTRRAAPSDLPGGAPTVADAGAPEARKPLRRVELWHALAAALLIFLFGESLLVRRA
jgi:hypothetical protein